MRRGARTGTGGLFDHIPLMRPWLGLEEWRATKEVILGGWVSQGPKVEEFERAIAARVGARHAVATNACTSAIHLALLVHGVRRGDEVIVPDLTCMADANAVIMAGAEPVFADVDPRTYNIDPSDAARRITRRTKAILAVDQIGLPADLDALARLARGRRLALIDDAATALGASYRGRPLGSHGLTATFSFHPRKMITTGEGGMLVTDDAGAAAEARVLRATGASLSDLERHKARGRLVQRYFTSGYNYRMTDIQAAVGIVQARKLDRMLRERRRQAAFYDEALRDVPELQVPFVPPEASHAYSSYMLRIRAGCRVTPRRVVERMARDGISCRYGIQPLHREPVFKDRPACSDRGLPVSTSVAESSFFIPIFPGLSQAQLERVAGCLKAVFGRTRGR